MAAGLLTSRAAIAQGVPRMTHETRLAFALNTTAPMTLSENPFGSSARVAIADTRPTHRKRDALIGFVIGAGAGAIIGNATWHEDPKCTFMCDTRRLQVGFGALVGGIAGALIGGFVVGAHDHS